MRRALTAVVLAATLLTGCSAVTPPDDDPKRSRTKVDTPELRRLKQAAQVEPCTPSRAPEVEGGMPEVTLPCLGGGQDVDVSGLRGPMVVNLWASWCGPCRDELPIYQQFHEKYGDQVRVVGIDFNDEMPRSALELLDETGATYPQLADINSDLSLQDPLPNFQGLPAIIFIDKDGSVVNADGDPRVEYKEIKSLDELRDLVRTHLDVSL